MARIGANILVEGIVQGVGFRPFIHKQITDHSLTGFIRNNSRGVEIEIEGEADRVRLFIDELWTKAPALAVVERVEPVFYSELKNYPDFRIIASQALPERRALISPDVCLCEDCRRELFDPADRRYRYPFINCTNCGPRYTIVTDVPYDRPLTTMGRFPLCPVCEKEYHTITDRRYHAQPVCCPDCGPRLLYYDAGGALLTEKDASVQEACEDALRRAVKLLSEGGILAVKGLGGLHLAARIDEPAIAEALRFRKGREEKPFAIMVRDLSAAHELCLLSDGEEKLLLSRERPIVLLRKKDPSAWPHLSENDRLGIMLPYTPLHELLLSDGPAQLIMTSANLSDQPILSDNEIALRELSGIADGFLLHDRDIYTRCDDSLVWALDGGPYFARRSRGYAPRPLTLPGEPSKQVILACGAEQKADFAFLKEDKAFLSPHIGDLKNPETLAHYERTVRHYERLFDLKPQAIVCDLHPDYLSTEYAELRAAAEGLPLLRVQHHHAHMAAALADRGVRGQAIGIIWDGTGCGTDGTVWGGEFLLGDAAGFTRAGSLRPFGLPGGDLCTKQISRTLYSLLSDADMLRSPGIRERLGLTEEQEAALSFQMASGVNVPLTSSMGRLFDAVSCLLGIRRKASYEGQAAVLLEAAASPNVSAILPYEITEADGRLQFDERPLLRALCELLPKRDSGWLAAAFLNTLIDMAVRITRRIRDDSGVGQVVLSGGTMQDLYLMTRLPERLQQEAFTVYHHRRVSANDEGLCLGQLAVARVILENRS